MYVDIEVVTRQSTGPFGDQPVDDLRLCAVLALLYPGMIAYRIFRHNHISKGGLASHRTLLKYGHFYTDYTTNDWRVYFFGIQHWCENISFAMFAVSSHVGG